MRSIKRDGEGEKTWRIRFILLKALTIYSALQKSMKILSLEKGYLFSRKEMAEEKKESQEEKKY